MLKVVSFLHEVQLVVCNGVLEPEWMRVDNMDVGCSDYFLELGRATKKGKRVIRWQLHTFGDDVVKLSYQNVFRTEVRGL